MNECHLCGLQAGFVKSHVIPQAFFLGNTEPTQRKLISQGQFPKKAPIGVYDSALLCAGCERCFTRVDDYGGEVLLRRRAELFESITNEKVRAAVESVPGSIDQDLLLRFFVSVLWRASRSTHYYFKRVNLGTLEEAAKKMMFPGNPLDNRFGAVLSCWKDLEKMDLDLKDVNMDPFAEKWDGVNAYRFYFGDVVAYIKADQRPFPPNLAKFALCETPQVAMVERDFTLSSDLEAMQATMASAKIPGGKPGLFW